MTVTLCLPTPREVEWRLTALCSRWLTTRRMGEDAPKPSFFANRQIGAICWIALLSRLLKLDGVGRLNCTSASPAK
jgi:hypothetical protein